MDAQTYMRRFSRWVRWRLPGAEADSVLADYADILTQRQDGDGAALVRDLGEPRQAARLLTEPRTYRRWLAAFAGMAVCLLLLLWMLLRERAYQLPAALVPFFLGMALWLVRFRPHRELRGTPIPRGLIRLLAAMAGIIAAAAIVVGSLFFGVWENWPPAWYGVTAHWTLCLAGTAGAGAGLFGLVKARISDRRWSALYVLGLTVLVISATVAETQHTLAVFTADWWVPCAIQCGVAGVVGAVGTGGALC